MNLRIPSMLGLALSALFASCTLFVDTDTSGIDESLTGPCGGSRTLMYDGAEGVPGERCGPCGEGFLVCNGLDALRCVGDTKRNVCGGCGILAFERYAPCGVCGDGYWTCSEDDADTLVCMASSSANACGGCGELDGAPGYPCSPEQLSAWTCSSRTEVQCTLGTPNACGGGDELSYQGEPALPGESCAGGCRDGVLVCDDAVPNGLTCLGAEPLNECGGCALLPDSEVPCGVCGGDWICDPTEGSVDYICDGPTPNACGGCTPLSAQPGSACGDGGVVVCSSSEAVTCDGGGVGTNPCGGFGGLRAADGEALADGLPGEACGDCGQGTITCVDFSTVTCTGDVDRNACGGCAQLTNEPAAPCGACGDLAWRCDGPDSVTCGLGGEAADELNNPCGGCGDLHGTPGAECGVCYTYACLGTSRLQCLYERDDGFCTAEGQTCEELNCESLLRVCVESDGELGGAASFCGECLPGYDDIEGQCVPQGACSDVEPCPEDQVSEPSECFFDEPCGQQSLRYTTITSFECVAGSCRSRLDVEATTRGCPVRNTEGLDVTYFFTGGVEPEEPDAPDAALTECLQNPEAPCTGIGQRLDYRVECRDGDPTEQFEVVSCELGEVEGWECPNGFCQDGECVRDDRQRIGGTCRADNDCVSANCSRRICAPNGFVTIPAGTFVMGSRDPAVGSIDEQPTREVTISRPFFMLISEVPAEALTDEFEDVRRLDCPLCPAAFVTWTQAVTYANLASAAAGLPLCYTFAGSAVRFEGVECLGYRLPTEAEWEYAARAGSRDDFYCGQDASCVEDVDGVASESLLPIGTFGLSPWGLYGVVGGVTEWVWDVYGEQAYLERDTVDPLGPTDPRRASVARGCPYDEDRRNCRHSRRYSADPSTAREDLGFRLVRTVPF